MCMQSVLLASLYSSMTIRNSDDSLRISFFGLALVFLTPALGGFLFGFDIGATSFVLSMLQSRHRQSEYYWWKTFHHSSWKQGLFVSAVSLGALLGSHIVLMYLVKTMGRRMEIRVCAVLYLIGTVLNVMSGTILSEASEYVGFSCLILGRLIYGVGVGFIMHGAPTYMAEMCPPSVRGAVVTAKEAVIVIGILVGYVAGYLLSLRENQKWADLYALTVLGSFPMLLLAFVIPRSKRWLLLKGYKEEALQSMKFVYHGNVQIEFEQLSSQIEVEPTIDESILKQSFIFSRMHRRSFIASMGLVVLQQCSGQPSVLSYTTVLFSAAGLTGESSVATALYMIVNSIFTVCMVDRVGRKALLQRACLLMMVSLLILTMAFWNYQPSEDELYFGTTKQTFILLSMFVYIGAYQLGFGPITWLIVSEVWPIAIRGEAIAFGVELNFLLNFLVQFLFPSLQELLGWGGTFLVFAFVLVFAIYFVQTHVPETKGLTLEEIEGSMKSDGIAMTEETHLTDKLVSTSETVACSLVA